MYEAREGDFNYVIRRRSFRRGKTVWRWEARHAQSGVFLDAGSSIRSHDHAKTSALNAISQALKKTLGPARDQLTWTTDKEE
jgi:hypothetical protein